MKSVADDTIFPIKYYKWIIEINGKEFPTEIKII